MVKKVDLGCVSPRILCTLLTNRGEEHVVEEEGEGDDEEDELPRVARLVEVGADARARQVLSCHAAHDFGIRWMTSASSV